MRAGEAVRVSARRAVRVRVGVKVQGDGATKQEGERGRQIKWSGNGT